MSVPSNNFTLAKGRESLKAPTSVQDNENEGDDGSLSSRESSVESAILNAQNLGIEGEAALQGRIDAIDENTANAQAAKNENIDAAHTVY